MVKEKRHITLVQAYSRHVARSYAEQIPAAGTGQDIYTYNLDSGDDK